MPDRQPFTYPAPLDTTAPDRTSALWLQMLNSPFIGPPGWTTPAPKSRPYTDWETEQQMQRLESQDGRPWLRYGDIPLPKDTKKKK